MAVKGARRGFVIWGSVLAGAIVVAVATIGLRGHASLDSLVNWAQLASMVIALPALFQVIRQLQPAPPLLAASAGTAEAVLADAVAEQWRAESLRRSLHDPDPMPVRWRITSFREAMDQPDNIQPGATLAFPARSDDVAAVVTRFRALRRPRLVILGDGGTGKTTLAVQLTRELLATRTPDDPVPVLLTLTDWNPAVDRSVHRWVTRRIHQDYPDLRRPELGADVAHHLVSRSRILPVLDGADELSPSRRAALITTLNDSLADTDQLILTCRTADFVAAVDDSADVLRAALVLEPEPLNPADAASYLRRCLPPGALPEWIPILAALPTTPAVARTTSTALGLWLLRTVFVDARADPTSLLGFADAEALRAHLYRHLVAASVTSRMPSRKATDAFLPRRRYNPEQVEIWLTGLAELLRNPDSPDQPDRDVAWWQIASRFDAFTGWLVITAGVFGAMLGLTAFVVGNWWIALIGAVVGVALALPFCLLLDGWTHEPPGYADLRIHGRYREFLSEMWFVAQTWWTEHFEATRTLVVWVTVAVLAISVPVVTNDPSAASPPPAVDDPVSTSKGLVVLLIVVVVDLLVALAAMTLITWSEVPARGNDGSSPGGVWRADRALTGVRVAVVGVASAVVVGSLIGTFSWLLGAPAAAILLAAGASAALAGLVGMCFGIVVGEHHAWLVYAATTVVLAAHRRLPLRLMRFLDDAHRLGLLRTVGPVYQFRHADLQDHLAGRRREP